MLTASSKNYLNVCTHTLTHICMFWQHMSVLSCVRLFATPWTAAHQAPLSMGFRRQEYWSGLPFPSPGDLPNPGIKPRPPALQADSLPSGKARQGNVYLIKVTKENKKFSTRMGPHDQHIGPFPHTDEDMRPGHQRACSYPTAMQFPF